MTHDAQAVCVCVADHRPPVLEYERHHILPLAMGGSDDLGNVVWLCPSAHTNVHELLRAMVTVGRELPEGELESMHERRVSRYAGAVARDGFRRWREAITRATQTGA